MFKIKRGSFFSLDAIVGIIIVTGALLILISIKSETPDIERAQMISSDIMEKLDSVKISDICQGSYVTYPSNCDCIYNSVTAEYCSTPPGITNSDMSLLEILGELYSKGEVDAVRNILNDTINLANLVPNEYEFYIVLDDYSNGSRVENEIYPN